MKRYFCRLNFQILMFMIACFFSNYVFAGTAAFTITPAGPDFSEGVTVTLDGSSSTPTTAGGTLTYAWSSTWICNPAPCTPALPAITFSGQTSQKSTFITPILTAPTTKAVLDLQLIVTEGTTTITSSQINSRITVNKPNQATALSPIIITAVNPPSTSGSPVNEGSEVVLSTNGSKDANGGDKLTYKWFFISSTPDNFYPKLVNGNIMNPNNNLPLGTGDKLIFVAPLIPVSTTLEPTLLFRLEVTDISSPVPPTNKITRDISITVKKTGGPVADAGTPKLITIQQDKLEQGVRIALNGSNSSPATVAITPTWNYTPTLVGSTDQVININNNNSLITYADIGKNVPPGIYRFTLKIIDALSRTSESTMTIQIVARNQVTPIIKDITISNQTGSVITQSAPGNSVITFTPQLDDGTYTYEWTGYVWSGNQLGGSLAWTNIWSGNMLNPVNGITELQGGFLPNHQSRVVSIKTPFFNPATPIVLLISLKATNADNLSVIKNTIINITETNAPPLAWPIAKLSTSLPGESVSTFLQL